MRIDLDTWLLDRVFQPLVDHAADWASNFHLARGALVSGIVLSTVALAWTLTVAIAPVVSVLAIGATLATYVGAQQLRTQITRAERQSRPGLMNIRRVTMRFLRSSLLSATFGSLVLVLLPGADLGCVWVLAGCICWLATSHFISCSPSPPTRTVRRASPVFAGAS